MLLIECGALSYPGGCVPDGIEAKGNVTILRFFGETYHGLAG